MQATLTSRRPRPKTSVQPAPKADTPDPVAEEIFSFIAVRDVLLAEAEEQPTETSLHRVWMANEFVERCLEPARPPYQAQSLPAAEANFERRRCKTVRVRLAALRSRIHRQAA
jgi:hypothetical protein